MSGTLQNVAHPREAFDSPILDPWSDEWKRETEFLLPSLIPANTIVGIFGPPKQGKTFAAIRLALAISAPQMHAAFGAQVSGPARKVLYVYAEVDNPKNLAARITAMDPEGHARTGLRLYQPIGAGFVLGNVEARNHLDNAIAEFGPDVLIIDTLRKAHTGDENSSADMTRLFDAFNQWIRDGLSLFLIHHSAKPQMNVRSSGPMGSQAIMGSTRAWLSLYSSKGLKHIVFEGNDVPRQHFTTDPKDIYLSNVGKAVESIAPGHTESRTSQRWKQLDLLLPKGEWQTADFVQTCIDGHVGKARTAKALLKELTDLDILEKVAHGRYRRAKHSDLSEA